MGHANRPRLDHTLSVDSKPWGICLSASHWGHPNSNRDRIAHSQCYRDTYSHGKRDSYSHSRGDANSHCDRNTHCDGNTNAEAHSRSESWCHTTTSTDAAPATMTPE